LTKVSIKCLAKRGHREEREHKKAWSMKDQLVRTIEEREVKNKQPSHIYKKWVELPTTSNGDSQIRGMISLTQLIT
jgi:hypothetical protein